LETGLQVHYPVYIGRAATAEKKPPVVETAAIAWRDAFRAIEVMPVVAGIAFVL
jgi:hypothetical protein